MTTDAWHLVRQRLERLGVGEADLEEVFVRSGGHGGQNVNKVATCVILTHPATGVSVRCETERSQARNRLIARERLAHRLEERIREERARQRHESEKVRRRHRRPGAAARARNVEQKRRRGAVKRDRRRSFSDE